ncbi:hypothetical protein OSJ97_24880, partial [Escherichia coli]|nr:hypothetical protein [Escherichia coli]
ISPSDLRNIVKDLAEVEFIRIFSEGETYKAILPTIPYYDEMYTKIGEYVTSDKKLNEAEQLAITILDKLTQTPVAKQSLIQIGADAKLLE